MKSSGNDPLILHGDLTIILISTLAMVSRQADQDELMGRV